jgi:inorganic pyrophosphatase
MSSSALKRARHGTPTPSNGTAGLECFMTLSFIYFFNSDEFREILAETTEVLIELKGDPNSKEFRVHALDVTTEQNFSLWHDVPLYPTLQSRDLGCVNMINEVVPSGSFSVRCSLISCLLQIPRCSRKKFEIATNEPHNPIKQDIKKGLLREFGKGDVYFNYGCIPQTWEDPDTEHPDAKARGDNDPLDVCEIGLRILGVGEITAVKILGCLCLIDEGEADWKMIAISLADPWAPLLNDVSDVEEKLPGTISAIREWFRTYKVHDGKPENVFGLEERCMPAAYALRIIDETHHAWKQLVRGHKDMTDRHTLSFPKLSEAQVVISTNGTLRKNLSSGNLSVISQKILGVATL